MKKIILTLLLLFMATSSIFYLPAEVRAAEIVANIEEDFIYEITEGQAWLKKYTGTAEDVIVPSQLGGYPVVGIKQGAFSRNETMKTLKFSEGLQSLASESIYDCSKLEKISYPSTLRIDSNEGKALGGWIDHCENLKKIEVAEGNTSLKVYDGALYSYDMKILIYYPSGNTQETFIIPEGVEFIKDFSCAYNQYVKEIIMSDTVTYIGNWAFDNDTALKKLNISKNCETIGQFAINNTSIQSLVIPASVEWIMDYAIDHNTKLENITVEEGNPYYYSVDGVLYRDTTLVAYPAAKTDKICYVKDGTRIIGTQAFGYSSNLEEIVLPNTMEIIEHLAFLNCVKLAKINLPNGIMEIGYDAFVNNESLEQMILPYSLTSVSAGLVQQSVKTITIQENVVSIAGDQSLIQNLETVYFTGNAPENVVSFVTQIKNACTIYYPKGNTTWKNVITECNAIGDYFTWKEHSHVADSQWIEDWPASDSKNGQESQRCKECGAVCAVREISYKDGLNKYADGNLYYFSNNRIDITYNGVADYEGDTWFVKNGKADPTVNGVVQCGADWYYFKNGKVQRVTSVEANENGWWYIENGKVNFEANTVAQNQNGWWYIQNGQVDFTYDGLGTNANGTWYIEDGMVDFSKSGVLCRGDGWYLFSNGQLQKVTTVAQNENGWWYVEKGQVDFEANTVANNANGWWYIKNGMVDFNYDGIGTNANGTWYIENGQVDFSKSGVLCRGNGWYLFANGQLQKVTTVAQNENGWWYVKNGQVDFTYTGVASNENGYWYVENGALNWNYSGKAVDANGKEYNVVNGMAILV